MIFFHKKSKCCRRKQWHYANDVVSWHPRKLLETLILNFRVLCFWRPIRLWLFCFWCVDSWRRLSGWVSTFTIMYCLVCWQLEEIEWLGLDVHEAECKLLEQEEQQRLQNPPAPQKYELMEQLVEKFKRKRMRYAQCDVLQRRRQACEGIRRRGGFHRQGTWSHENTALNGTCRRDVDLCQPPKATSLRFICIEKGM